jgi:putative hydrolase of HD superfamily
VTSERLRQQLAFVVEIDKAKEVLRNSLLTESTRRENDAEHAWHLASMVLVLAEYAPTRIDIGHTVAMALIHDLVEIDAGDAYIYDAEARERQVEAEKVAADRIFNLLPKDQGANVRELWLEFEARETPEAKFAAALDRLQPLLLNFHTKGQEWQAHGVRKDQVVRVNSSIADGAPELWEFADALIEEAAQLGYLPD